MEAHTLADRPDLAGRVASADVWPEYNMHGDVLNRYWGRLADELPEYQLVLAEGGDVVAELHTAPIPWDGTVEGLPKGIDGAIEDAFERPGPGALCALAAEILPGHRGRGLDVGHGERGIPVRQRPMRRARLAEEAAQQR